MVISEWEVCGFPVSSRPSKRSLKSFSCVKIAIDNFFDKLGLKALPVGDLWGSAMIVKPRPIVS